jgi:hypothetical protein
VRAFDHDSPLTCVLGQRLVEESVGFLLGVVERDRGMKAVQETT